MGEHRFRILVAALRGLLTSEITHTLHPDPDHGTTGQRRARDVRAMLEGLGPFYVKVGQILSTRPDIVSDDMITELQKLHDQVAEQPFATLEAVLADEMGPLWRSHFTDIDTTRALGSASLAQVHAATLADGQPVVIKIQRPGIRPIVHADMALLRRAAKLFAKIATEFNAVIDVESMLERLFDAMSTELDFTLEAQNMERARAEVTTFKHLDIPEVLLATPRVMIQSRAPGCSIRDANPTTFTAGERTAIGRDLLAYMYQSYFTTGFFHADPHPGNIFVHPGEKAHLIDWGMVGRVDRGTRIALLLILVNIAMNDGKGLARAWIALGRATAGADVPTFDDDMQALVTRIADSTLEELNFGVTLTTLLIKATKRGIRTSPAVSVLGKSFGNIEGSIRYLAPELSLTDTFRDVLRDIMLDLLDDTLSEQQAARTTLEILTAGSAAIQSAHTILNNIVNGEIAINISQKSRLEIGTKRRRTYLFAAIAIYLWNKKQRTKGNR
ncbi:ABC1 kinase family protein [Amycolatopsis anabasis]|uniref:ABC1 kinase family protein n=1 Tax=Amycolatopsis anabasis TaxID=1840409 RepID=UPI00131B2CF0|nr:AarF/UbiB family protein [Amycolatopsis anabasis]